MVLVAADSRELSTVVDASEATYRAHGMQVTQVSWSDLTSESAGGALDPPTIITSDQTLECILDREADPAELAKALQELDGQGWKAVVVVPLERLGHAHVALRGTPALLQSWWTVGDTVHFGHHEIP